MKNNRLKIFRKTRVICNRWSCINNNTGFCQKKTIKLDIITTNGKCLDYNFESNLERR